MLCLFPHCSAANYLPTITACPSSKTHSSTPARALSQFGQSTELDPQIYRNIVDKSNSAQSSIRLEHSVGPRAKCACKLAFSSYTSLPSTTRANAASLLTVVYCLGLHTNKRPPPTSLGRSIEEPTGAIETSNRLPISSAPCGLLGPCPGLSIKAHSVHTTSSKRRCKLNNLAISMYCL